MMEWTAGAPPRLKARIAGGLYLLSFLTAAFTELFARGSLNFAGGLVAVLGMVVVTLLLYDILRPVNRSLALLAAFFGLVGLSFEALRLQPRGVNVAIVFAGLYCLLVGCLIFRSTFLPRALGALMTLAALAWLTWLSNPVVKHLSPYNLATGALAELSVFLWLLVMGLNAQRWNELASARRVSPRKRRLGRRRFCGGRQARSPCSVSQSVTRSMR
jgi:hypothetical protein